MVNRPLGVTTHTALGTPDLGELDLHLAGLGHRDQHRAEVESAQLGGRRVVEVLDVERAVELVGRS